MYLEQLEKDVVSKHDKSAPLASLQELADEALKLVQTGEIDRRKRCSHMHYLMEERLSSILT